MHPHQGVDSVFRPRQGDLAKMAASGAPRLPQKSWALSLGHLLTPRGEVTTPLLFPWQWAEVVVFGGQLRC